MFRRAAAATIVLGLFACSGPKGVEGEWAMRSGSDAAGASGTIKFGPGDAMKADLTVKTSAMGRAVTLPLALTGTYTFSEEKLKLTVKEAKVGQADMPEQLRAGLADMEKFVVESMNKEPAKVVTWEGPDKFVTKGTSGTEETYERKK